MRFYRLGDVPAGLHYDEGFNGLDALALVDIPLTDWPIFFNGNYGREPLFIWLSGLAHALFGPSIWTARFISALSGVLLIPALAWLGWQLAPPLGVRNRQLFTLWCPAAVLALMWSQVFARYGIRATLFVLLETLLWAAAWWAWQRRPPAIGAWVITGVLAGLSFYTYLPARLLPLVLLPLLGVSYLQDRTRLQRHFPGLLSGALAALLVATPLGIYFLQNPLAFSTRVGQLAAGTDGKEGLSNLVSALKMFLHSGDLEPKNNLPARPALDPFLALPFLFGLGLALRRCWQMGRIFLLVGLGTFLLPTVLSSEAPNFQRAIGVLPFIGLLVAYGAEGLVRYLGLLSGRKIARVAQALAWLSLAGAIGLTNWTYFVVWPPVTSLWWNIGYSQLVRHIGNENESRVYISPRHVGWPSLNVEPHPVAKYLLAANGVTAQFHDERSCIRVALSEPARYFWLVDRDTNQLLPIDSYFPRAKMVPPVVFSNSDSTGAREFQEARDTPVVFPEMRPYNVELADGINLEGFWLSQEEILPGQTLLLRLFWRVTSTPTANYNTLIHLVQAAGDGTVERVTGYDRPPGNGSCPTNEWLPEEMVVDQAELNMPEALPQGELFLAVGFYTLADGRRLPVRDMENDQILIGPLSRSP